MTRTIPALGLIALLAGCGPETSTLSTIDSRAITSLDSNNDSERAIMSKKREIEEKYHLSISYEVNLKGTSQFLDRIESVLQEIHPTLLAYLEHIDISKRKCRDDAKNDCEGGQPIFTEPKAGRVQVSPSRPFDADLLVHSLAHIISAKNPTIQEKWDEMVKIDPMSGEYRAIRESPTANRGFLSTRGADISYDSDSMKPTWKEDLASYLSAVYLRSSPFVEVDSNQEAYLPKLDFLRERDLISAVQYQRARTELGTDLTKAN